MGTLVVSKVPDISSVCIPFNIYRLHLLHAGSKVHITTERILCAQYYSWRPDYTIPPMCISSLGKQATFLPISVVSLFATQSSNLFIYAISLTTRLPYPQIYTASLTVSLRFPNMCGFLSRQGDPHSPNIARFVKGEIFCV